MNFTQMANEKSNLIFEKGSDQQKFLKLQVGAFLNLAGIKSLSAACVKTEHDYQLIYGQLNGWRMCKVSIIEDFIQKIDPTKHIDIWSGKPHITNIRK